MADNSASVEAGRGERETLDVRKRISHVIDNLDSFGLHSEKIDAILAALSQGNGGEAVGEPVAWHIRERRNGKLTRGYIEFKREYAEQRKQSPDQYEVRPLYAAPSSPPEGVREALAMARKRIQLVRNDLTDAEQSVMLKNAIADIERAFTTLTTTPSRGLIEAAEWHENMAATLRRNTQRFNEEWSETTYRDEEYHEARTDIRRDEVKAIFHENSAAALRTLAAKGTATADGGRDG